MATETADDHESQGKRDRSPNYPAITFTDALGRAKTIWEAEKKHPVSPEIAAQHLGYKKLNGASYPVLAALKRYGLMNPDGKDVRISEDAHFIFVHPEGHPDRDQRIRELVMKPSLFGEVLAKFPDGLPSDVNLRAKLRTTWNFASDSAADTFIKALREAVRLRDSGVAKDGAGGDDNGEFIKEPNMTPPPSPAIKTPLADPKTHNPPAAPTLIQPNQSGITRQWEIASGRFAAISLPSDPTVDDVEIVEEFLAILKQELALVWKRKQRAQEAGGQKGGAS